MAVGCGGTRSLCFRRPAMRTHALVVLAVVLSFGADAPKEDTVKQDKLQGTWAPVSYERGGKKLDEKEFKDLRFVVEGHRFAFLRRGKEKAAAKGTFKIDQTQKP